MDPGRQAVLEEKKVLTRRAVKELLDAHSWNDGHEGSKEFSNSEPSQTELEEPPRVRDGSWRSFAYRNKASSILEERFSLSEQGQWLVGGDQICPRTPISEL